jgi:DNA-binding NtrC family response regulator
MKMENNIAVVSTDRKLRDNLFSLLKNEHYKAALAGSITELEQLLGSGNYIAAIVDIDLLQISNRTIREISTHHPGLHFLCISTNRFHPDLKDAFASSIYACIQKPIDDDELLYFIRSIFKDSEVDTE